MADIFISYASEDRPKVKPIAKALISGILGPLGRREKVDQVAEIPESSLEQKLEVQPKKEKSPQFISRRSASATEEPSEPQPELTAASEPKRTEAIVPETHKTSKVMTQVFISYAREDYKTAKRLYDDLKHNGVTPWMDKENILIGQKWRVSIGQAIKECTYFMALLSNNSVTKRGCVQKELKLALDILDELPQSGVFILPILLEPCDPVDERLQDLNWGELYTSYDDCLTQILRVLRPDQVVRKKPAQNQLKPSEHSTTNRIETSTSKYELRNKPLTVSIMEANKVFNLDKTGVR